MPDIDIDFSDVRRDEVIEYVVEKDGVATSADYHVRDDGRPRGGRGMWVAC